MRPTRQAMTRSSRARAIHEEINTAADKQKSSKNSKTLPKSNKKLPVSKKVRTKIAAETTSPISKTKAGLRGTTSKLRMAASDDDKRSLRKDDTMDVDESRELTIEGKRTKRGRLSVKIEKVKPKLETIGETESKPNSTGKRGEADEGSKTTSRKSEKLESTSRKRTLSSASTVRAKRAKVVVERSARYSAGAGIVLTMGQGDVGQLGLGEDVLEKKKPGRVPTTENIIDICAGGMHTVCLSEDGKVITFGCNDEGALGRDTSKEGSEYEPGFVDIDGKAIQISAGDSHSAALTEDGRVFAWGTYRDMSGAMGLVTNCLQTTPHRLLPGVSVAKISSGSDHLAILTTAGHLYTCGCAEQGQLGRVAECFSSRGGRKGLDLVLNPALAVVPRQKGKEILFGDVWAGSYSTFVRAQDSTDIYVSGLNNYFQLGSEETNNHYVLQKSESFSARRWIQIASGQHHTLALDENGDVYALGRKEYGRLGLGSDAVDTPVPTAIPELKNVGCVNIACGVATSYAVAKDGTVYAWGMGTNGALGTGDEDDVLVPTAVTGKQLENYKTVVVSGGGQHAVLLAIRKDENSHESPSVSC